MDSKKYAVVLLMMGSLYSDISLLPALAQPKDEKPDNLQVNLSTAHRPGIVFSPDQKFFADLGASGAIIYCKSGGEQVRTMYHCSAHAAVFSPDGFLLCTAGAGKNGAPTLVVWNVADGTRLWSFEVEANQAPAIVFSTDNTLLAFTPGNSRAQLFDLCQGVRRWSVPLNRRIATLDLDENQRVLRIFCADKSVKRLSLDDGGLLSSRPI